MTVKKVLCLGGFLFVPGHEAAVAAENAISFNEKQADCNNVELVSYALSDAKTVRAIRSVQAPSHSNSSSYFPMEYPYTLTAPKEKKKAHQIPALSSKKMIQMARTVKANALPYRPLYRGEKRPLTPPSPPKVRSSWLAPKQLWQDLNIHHHARKFDHAYVREKIRG